MSNEARNSKAIPYLIASVICFVAYCGISVAAFSLPHFQGNVTYFLVTLGFLWFLPALTGVITGFMAVQRLKAASVRIAAIAMIALNITAVLLAVLILLGGLSRYKERAEFDRQREGASTNAVSLAFAEFRSNHSFYLNHYTNVVQELASFNSVPLSSLRSREVLKKRATNLDDFIKAGVQLREFYANGPDKFREEIESSGQSPLAITNALRNFKRRDLDFCNAEDLVVEKTLGMMSNTFVLNNMLLYNFDRWHVSNE